MKHDQHVSSLALRRFARDFSKTKRRGLPTLAGVKGRCVGKATKRRGAVARANFTVSTSGERKSADFKA